jgi:hypothetical protein
MSEWAEKAEEACGTTLQSRVAEEEVEKQGPSSLEDEERKQTGKYKFYTPKTESRVYSIIHELQYG